MPAHSIVNICLYRTRLINRKNFKFLKIYLECSTNRMSDGIELMCTCITCEIHRVIKSKYSFGFITYCSCNTVFIT